MCIFKTLSNILIAYILRIVLKFLVILFIFSCTDKKQLQNKKAASIVTKIEASEPQKPQSLFDLLVNRHENPAHFSDRILPKFDFSKRFTQKEVSVLKLDTTQIDQNDYYVLTDEKFLKKELNTAEFLIYYKHQYGDQLAKILRVQRKDAVFELTLSMYGGDGNDQYKTTTHFINDSIFVSTHTKTSGDLIHSANNGKEAMYEYYTDSIISRYRYDESFQVKLLQKDTLQFAKQMFYRDQKKLWNHLNVYSKPFKFQNNMCIWEFYIPNYNTEKGVLYRQNLLDATTKKIILKGSEIENYVETVSELFNANQFDFEIKDLNFDGFKDAFTINSVKSGTAGNFTDVYLFKKELGIFEYDSIFSGYNLQIHPVEKMISHAVQNGNYSFLKEIYVDTDATIKFINTFSASDISVTEDYKSVYFYEKTVDQKVLKSVTDTITDASITFEQWKRKHN